MSFLFTCALCGIGFDNCEASITFKWGGDPVAYYSKKYRLCSECHEDAYSKLSKIFPFPPTDLRDEL